MDRFNIQTLLYMTPILLLALPVHEFAHGYVAYKMGDPTAKQAGRLTLNPFRHLDLMGVIMMYVAGFGWAKPVPVNSFYFKNRRMGMILVAMAGPLSNLILAFVSYFIWGGVVKLISLGVIPLDTMAMDTAMVYAQTFFQTLVYVNVSLAVFNLLPVPPLDGSRLISSFIPEESYFRFARYEQYIGLAFIALVVFLPGNIIGNAVSTIASPIYNSMSYVISLVYGL